MRLPIAYALGFPRRAGVAFGTLAWDAPRRLDFEAPDRAKFPCLDLAYAAGRAGETAPAWLNGANEAAVAAFLGGRLPWRSIASVLAEALDGYDGTKAASIDVVIEADRRGREAAWRAAERAAA
jgi:1-deoxy-D-xylulose-5-phosphate reductoisomerase